MYPFLDRGRVGVGSSEGGRSRRDGTLGGGISLILALSIFGVAGGGGFLSFEHLLAPFPGEGETEALRHGMGTQGRILERVPEGQSGGEMPAQWA